jgi:hypothetical protein
MANSGEAQTKQNVPHGNEEGVPSRSGVSSSKPAYNYANPQQDSNTNERRAHYGEDPKFLNQGNPGIQTDPNCVESKPKDGILTRDQQIRLGYEETSFGRASTQ